MTTRAAGALAWMQAHQGIPYNAGDDRLTDPPEDHSSDCSGTVWRALHHGAGLWLPPVLSWTQAAWCYDAGLAVSIDAAFAEAGDLVFMGPNRGLEGWGPTGHVAITDGHGGVWENPSAGHKSGHTPNCRGRKWTGAARFPGWNEQLPGSPPVTPPNWDVFVKGLREDAAQHMIALADKHVVVKAGSVGLPVTAVQNAVNLADDEALALDGQYGSKTGAAVLRFQQRFFLGQPWEQDAQAGPHTEAGLAFYLRERNAA